MMTSKFDILTDYSLYLHNTFRIPVSAKYFACVTSVDQLLCLQQSSTWHDYPRFILGEGSNILFTQNYGGLVVQNAIKGIELIDGDRDRVVLRCGAGEHWDDVVAFAVQHGLYGIENLSLIPGTVGAAPIQNIGAYGVELKDVFVQCEAVDVETGAVCTFDLAESQFGYRDSIFKRELRDRMVITQVDLCLSKAPNFHLEYYALKDYFADVALESLTLQQVRDAVIFIRQSKLPDPKHIPNAGSFFKNPRVSHARYDELLTDYQDLPNFPAETGMVKIPAAWLIERCGWKGRRQGHVGVHDTQALVLVNHGGGDGDEIKALALSIRNDVKNKFNIDLEPEVRFIE